MNTSPFTDHTKAHRPILTLNLLAVILALAQMGPGAARVAAYDLSTDYSPTSNPSGVWSYGAMTSLGGPLTLFNVHQPAFGDNGVQVDVWGFGPFAPEIWHNGTANIVTGDGGQGIYLPGAVGLYSGGNGVSYAFGVARFTAPQAGSYLLQTTVQNYLNGSRSADSDFRVLDNGTQLFIAQILPSPSSPGPAYSYTTTLNLAGGETIDFAVGRGLDGNGNFSAVTIQASLTPVPEPATFALAGLGALATCIIRRRQK